MGIPRPAARCDLGDTRRRLCRRTDAGRSVIAWLLAVVLVIGAGGYAAYYFGYLDRFLCDGGTCTAQDVLPPEELDLPDAREPQPVLAAASGPPARAAAVRSATRGLLRDSDLGKHVGFAVRDLTHGKDVWSYGKGTFTPASTLKLFTGLAALEVMDPGTRFTTSVERNGTNLVLVGGGDPYLAAEPAKSEEHAYPEPATLSRLAKRTARSLRSEGVTSVRLGYDDSLFDGPAVNKHWEPDYVPSVTTPVSALWADQGVSDKTGVRSQKPARGAATVFQKALEKRGVTVRGPVRRAAGDGDTIARVRSAPLEQIVQSLIEHSDNQAAEVVLRHTAIAADEPPTFAGGVRAVRRTLTAMGVPWKGNRIFDGSGLARGDRVTLESELAVLQRAATKGHGGMLDDLPVAGFNGSLADRFTASRTDDALGRVRAKTGTLTGVHGLAGTTVDADGTALAFVVIADKVKPKDTLGALSTLDRVAAKLAGCHCSG